MGYRFQWTPGGEVIVDDVTRATIPSDPANADYAALIASGAQIAPYVPPPVDLAAYAADKRWKVASGGLAVTVPGLGTMTLPSDDVAYSRLKGAAQDMAAGIIAEPITIVIGQTAFAANQATAEALYAAISRHWQACYAVQGAVVAAIQSGTITATTQIDAPESVDGAQLPAWPSNGA